MKRESRVCETRRSSKNLACDEADYNIAVLAVTQKSKAKSTHRDSCAICTRPPRTATSHVPAPGGAALALCRACWRRAQTDEPREAARQRFQALFRVRPPAFGLGGAVALVMPLARIGAEGRAAA